MDLAIEANRNSALHNTMQQALDVYNPLIHKARPTTVNQTKQRIRVNPTGWGNTLDQWAGRRVARFDMPRIGSLYNFGVKLSFKLPGEIDNTTFQKTGYRGKAATNVTTGNLNNTDTVDNTARGRLDRVYADTLLGFNMVETYVISSKSREIFRGTSEYLLTRFSQMDEDMKKVVEKAVTPVNLMSDNVDDMFYSPGVQYELSLPLFMFFNEHITQSLDVAFSEEVHIDITIRSPDQLFYYGNLGDLQFLDTTLAAETVQRYPNNSITGQFAWDQSTTESSYSSDGTAVGTTWTIDGTNATAVARFGTANCGKAAQGTVAVPYAQPMNIQDILRMQEITARHIQGIGSYMNVWNSNKLIESDPQRSTPTEGAYGTYGFTVSSPTFAFPVRDNTGQSPVIQFEGYADFVIQDTDAKRALRAQTFPKESGHTFQGYNISQETFGNLMAETSINRNLLGYAGGGQFIDPANASVGLTTGDTTRFVDLNLQTNNLVFATHFMVRKTSDFGGSNNTLASTTGALGGLAKTASERTNLGASRIYTRCLKVHYFQLMAAGRILYESYGDNHLNLTQSYMYNGTGLEFGQPGSKGENDSGIDHDQTYTGPRQMPIYTINFGLQGSRLENTGSLSYQNLNNPVLRIFFKPDDWAEYPSRLTPTPSGDSNVGGTEKPAQQHESDLTEARSAAAQGVQVDVLHEHWNIITVNSGNGEITSGLNQ